MGKEIVGVVSRISGGGIGVVAILWKGEERRLIFQLSEGENIEMLKKGSKLRVTVSDKMGRPEIANSELV